MVKLGIIGLGHMGGYHAKISMSLPDVSLVGIADPNKEHWQKIDNHSIAFESSYHQWLDQVDAVIIAVPTDYHYEIAKECLKAQKHVLIEKPLTKTVAQAQELFDLATQHNCTLHVGHVERFNSAMRQLPSLINDPYLIETHRMGPYTPRPQKDSVILDLMIHDIDLILNIVDAPISYVHVIGNKVTTINDDIAVVQIKFKNGTLANMVSSRASQIKQRTMGIHQKDSFISIDFTTQDITCHSPVDESTPCIEKYMKGNPLEHEIQYFIDAIISGQNRRNPTQDIKALQVVFDIEKQLSSL